MRYWRTTGNSNVTIKTGSTYISDSMTDITAVPTANLGFSTRLSSLQKVSTSDYNIERQSEIAIWSSKPEIVITTGTTTDSVEIPTASPGFSTMASPNKVSPSDCDNDRQPEWQCGHQNRKYVWQIGWQLQQQIWGFRPRPTRGNWPRAIATTTYNRKWQYRRFGRQSCNFWQSIVVAVIWLIL